MWRATITIERWAVGEVMKVYIDGQLYEKAEAKISVFDHGLLYGDGIFEGIRIYNKRIFKLDEHLDRLFDSAKAILLTIPMSYEDLRQATLETCKANGLTNGYIRLLVTRGVGSLGLGPDKCDKASVIIIADNIELYPEKYYVTGLRVVTAPSRRVSPSAFSPAIKSLNYLNNVMARIEAYTAHAQEVVMLNDQGYVAEGSGDNIFILKKGKLFTPPIYAGALGGITRLVIFDIAKEMNLPLIETNLTRYDLFVSDEFFLTGTGAEVVPVVEIDSRVIGDGKPGKVTGEIIRHFRELTQSSGTPIV